MMGGLRQPTMPMYTHHFIYGHFRRKKNPDDCDVSQVIIIHASFSDSLTDFVPYENRPISEKDVLSCSL